MNIVIAAAGVDAHLMSLKPELRMIKAALLYADTVTLTTPKIAMRQQFALMDRPDDEYRRRVQESGMTRRPGWEQAISMVHGARLHERPLTPEEARIVEPFKEDFAMMSRLRTESASRMLDCSEQTEFARAVDAGVLRVNSLDFGMGDPAQHADAVADEFEELLADALKGTSGSYPLFDEMAWLTVAPAVRRAGLTPREMAPANEAALATRFIVDQVEAYADAEIDVLLDVRARLADPLTRFRAAMARASHEIETTGFDASFDVEARAVFHREVEPALLELRESLHELGAGATLRRAAEPAAQWLGVGAAAGAVMTELQSAAVSAVTGLITAAGAGIRSELQHRRQIKTAQATNSYFFLWQANRMIRPPG